MNSRVPPPQLAYACLEQSRVAVYAHTEQKGHDVAIRRTRGISNRKDGDVIAIDLECSRLNLPPIHTVPRQITPSSSRAIWLFKLSARRLETGDWPIQVTNGKHNHELFTHKAAYPQGRSLTDADWHPVLSVTRAGVKPSHVIALLRQTSDVTVAARVIYNLRDS